MEIVVGTLSTRGWSKTPEEKISDLMNNYTESGYSQSVIYRGKIRSLAYAEQSLSQDPDALASKITDDLMSLYGAVFPEGCEVDVTWNWEEGSDTRYRINMAIKVVENGKQYDASRYVIAIKQGK